MKKLLIFAKTIDGGTGTYLTNLLETKDLLKNEFKFSVATLEEPIYMQRSNENFHYMKKRDYSFQQYSLTYKNINNFIKELFWIRKIIQNEKPDIILSVDVNCNIYIGLIKFLFSRKFKTIFTTHSDLEGNLNQKSTKLVHALLKVIIKFFYNKANLNICVSKDLSTNLRSRFGLKGKIITIYNGLKLIATTKGSSGLNNSIILMVARLDKQKDHMTLLKAFELVNKEIENARLWLVGDGPLLNDLELYVQKNNIEKNVDFLGWQTNLIDYFLRSDIFVLSSNREGFPYSLIEAMSFGLPIVCTNTPYGPSEILDNGKYGYLVPMKDHIKMKEAILELLINKETHRRYSQLALERSSLFTTEIMINNYAVEIEKLL